jgi:hypothetical protein
MPNPFMTAKRPLDIGIMPVCKAFLFLGIEFARNIFNQVVAAAVTITIWNYN